MTYLDFVKETICDLDQPVFEELKQVLLGEYITFSIIDHGDVTIETFAEEVSDYFADLTDISDEELNELAREDLPEWVIDPQNNED